MDDRILAAARRWVAALGIAATASFALAGCSSLNPVNWYRDAMGISKNDPPPDAPNTKNLEAGGKEPFPNLGSVPPPPMQALSSKERDALTQQLIADRANAKYINEELRAGPGPQVAPPPALVAEVPPKAPPTGATAAASTGKPAPEAAPAAPSAETASPKAPAATNAAAAPAAAPVPRVEATAVPPPAPVAPAPAAPTPSATPPSAGAPVATNAAAPPPAAASQAEAAAAPAPATPPSATAASAPSAPASGKLARGSEAPPRESSLTSPTVSSVPQPEMPRPAPPPPETAASASTAAPAAEPQRLASLEAPASAARPVAQIAFSGRSTTLSSEDKRILGQVVPLQRESGAPLRVVGHAAAGRSDSAAQQLASFRIALDRANAVAAALRQAGVAPDRILVETAPAGSGAADRAEIFLER